MLLAISLVNAGCSLNDSALAPVAVTAAAYYEVSGDAIDLFTIVPWFITTIGLLVSSIVENILLRPTCILHF